ncbi:MAG TPA: SAM-dependent methyltransferase [Syntrophobacteraceae bacterium]|nr:SAM-dependent methyltransferase [Syntrophobacteraceae bacterium]
MAVGLSVFCLSAASLAYELLLMRLLSIAQWNHFAFMIISLALLGYGASGTFLVLCRRRIARRYAQSFVANAVLFSVSVQVCFSLARTIPLNPLEILWDSGQWVFLFETYLLLSFPFFFAANGIGLTLTRFAGQVHRIYLFDLTGAGLGAGGVLLLLFYRTPLEALKIVSALGFLSAVLAASSQRKELRHSRSVGVLLLAGGLFLAGSWAAGPGQVRISEYKGLSRSLRVPDARILREATSPLGWLAVVESPRIPFRYAPGSSLNCTREPPPQLGIFIDGDSMTPVTRFDGNGETVSYLDCLPSVLPYFLLDRPEVLVLGAGGGGEVLSALVYGAKSVDAVELDPNLVRLVRDPYGAFAGGIYSHPFVRVHIGDARGYLARSPRRYDLIHAALPDLSGAGASSAGGLSETYLLTVEAMGEYLEHLRPGGLLVLTRWLRIPPRETLKLVATVIAAMERSGIRDPQNRLALVRSWNTATLLVKNGSFSREDLQRIETFCEERSFDVDYVPGIRSGKGDRFNLLEEPYLVEGTLALLGRDRDDFIERYKFSVAPATDDRPYFFHFFRWKSLPEFLSLSQKGGLPLLEWAYPLLILTLVQAATAAFLLVLLPVFFTGTSAMAPRGRMRTGIYFSCLGLAFLFVEIALIRKFTLFLHHPLYSATVVLSGMLVFAGLGSGVSERAATRIEKSLGPGSRGKVAAVVIFLIVSAALAELFFMPGVFRYFAGSSDFAKMAISLGVLAPLAFLMGMPFPLGLALLREQTPERIPWAWGVNGCSSVVSAVLAAVLAIHAGFNGVMLAALLLYGMGALAFWNFPAPATRGKEP